MSPVTETDALRIAKQTCADHKIKWEEPHRISKGLGSWRILMPSDRRGGNSMVIVSRKTGASRLHRYGR